MHPPGIKSFRIHQERKYTGLVSEHWVGLHHNWLLMVGGDHNTISILVEAESQNPRSGGQWCSIQLLVCQHLLSLSPARRCGLPYSAQVLQVMLLGTQAKPGSVLSHRPQGWVWGGPKFSGHRDGHRDGCGEAPRSHPGGI